ncbi:hypothetical protein GCM10010924_39580 [Rhizobium wenxiniae]|uniref:Uncharacterized protein n=1 Tax=Rhizobium wenxiniae TaxID=1737357 RepID=A0A7W9Y9X8_9HYPH|nr:hypothetical protein [Rhizobium wenxiniae]GGG06924.1 hypothetical protein GCM10010924_39580 [Rhizobium wenxiniae]
MTDPAKSSPESDAARSDAKTADEGRKDLKKRAEESLKKGRGEQLDDRT